MHLYMLVKGFLVSLYFVKETVYLLVSLTAQFIVLILRFDRLLQTGYVVVYVRENLEHRYAVCLNQFYGSVNLRSQFLHCGIVYLRNDLRFSLLLCV